MGHLFADVDGNFSAAAPLDDLQQYVPGSTLAGASLLPSAMPQQIKLHLLTPKGAAGKATFSVVASSSNPGLATNHPVSSPSAAPDIYFDTGSMKDVNLNKSTGDTAVTLFVNDYAAYGKIRVVAKSGSTIIADVTRAIPLDRNGNNIGDNGWNAAGVTVADSAETPGADRDSSPPLDLAIPSYASSFGDNLTRFEEYRGFMTRGVHTRTDPI